MGRSVKAFSQSESESENNKSYSEVFDEVFPYYLSMGMTYDQFWRDDPEIVKYYRKAQEIENDRMNYAQWLQGAYIYQAILCASPILHAFAKRGTKPAPYPNEPFSMNEKVEDDTPKIKNKNFEFMTKFAERINKKRGEKNG